MYQKKLWIFREEDGTIITGKDDIKGELKSFIPFFPTQELAQIFITNARTKDDELIVVDLVQVLVTKPPENGVVFFSHHEDRFQAIDLKSWLELDPKLTGEEQG